ncbi:FMN-dependent NADH-azoreductase [Actinoplanes teichomyceticus]|uniref:FMN-dependent NADH-azoreductase n=1 Tax=Actinoplanes teichomyceticus TaxID=1867 RepID=UPI0013DE4883|nr:NAD(P)H-dependent oxidoreductase [Actinoplanes teichomyceticus]
MTRLLYVKATPPGPGSRSGAVAEAFLDTFRDRNPDATVDVVDLFDTPLPTAADGVAAFRRRSRAMVDRFTAADHYLFSVPMWNFGIPYVLKHFIDVVTQPGLTFRLSPQTGYTGLLAGRTACVVYTSGAYAPGLPAHFGADFQSSYLDYWLGFLGLTQVTAITLRPTDFTDRLAGDLDRARDEARKAALAL